LQPMREQMNAKVAKPDKPAPTGSNTDIAKYVVAGLLLVAGFVGFYWFGTWATPLRGLLVAVGMVAAFAVFTQTAAGHQTLEFFGEARFELRKVVWPAREASIRTTGVIIAVIVVMSLLLSLIDLLIGTAIGKLLS
jgi:preprotein translocase subunit SecE